MSKNNPEIAEREAELSTATGFARTQAELRLAELLRDENPARSLALAQHAGDAVAEPRSDLEESERELVLASTRLAAAKAHLRLNRANDALQPVEQAQDAFEALDRPREMADAAICRGSALTILGRLDEACRVLRQSIDWSSRLDDHSDQLARLQVQLADNRRTAGESAEALDLSRRARAIARTNRNRELEALAVRGIGDAHWAAGDTHAFLTSYEELVQIASELQDQALQIDALGMVGLARSDFGDYGGALVALQRSLDLARHLGDRSRTAVQLGNIAATYGRMDAATEGIPMAEEALEVFRELGLASPEASTLRILSFLHETNGSLTRAVECARRSLEITQERRMKGLEGSGYARLGQAQLKAGSTKDAASSLQRARELAREIKDVRLECVSLICLTEMHVETREFATALDVAEEARTLIREHGTKKMSSDLHKVQSQAYVGLGDFEKALEHTQLHYLIEGELKEGQAGISLESLRVLYQVSDRDAKLRSALKDARRFETRAHSVLNSLEDGIVVLDEQGIVLAVNEAWGRTSDSVFAAVDAGLAIGVDWVERLLASDTAVGDPGELARGIRAILAGTRSRFECEYCASDDSDGGWRRLRAVAVTDAFAGVIIIRADITENKQLLLKSEETRNEIQRMERISTVGELSASIAHELHQPLTAIMSNAQAAQRMLAGDSGDAEELSDILDDIVADDRRASDIIRRLRAFLARHEVNREEVDVNTALADVVTMVRSDCMRRRIDLVTDFHAGPLVVTGDRIGLQQVFLNIVVNAVDALNSVTSDEKRISIDARALAPHEVRIRISNNGPPLDSDLPERMFEPFFSTKSQGMGMGLAVARAIISAHHGQLSVENDPAGDVTFSIELPIGNG